MYGKKRRYTSYKQRPRSRTPAPKRKKTAVVKANNTVSINKYQPLGRSLKCNHEYVDRGSLNPAIGGIPAVHFYSANGLFDPDITGTGAQPTAFDDMERLFVDYTTIYARITVCFENTDSNNAQIVGVRLRNSPIGGTSDVLCTGADSNYGIIGQAGSSNTVSITKDISIEQWTGRKNIMSEDDLKGTSSANPTEQAYFQVFAFPVDSSADADAVYYHVHIQYVAVWTTPRAQELD